MAAKSITAQVEESSYGLHSFEAKAGRLGEVKGHCA
jgi:hypothetical protein